MPVDLVNPCYCPVESKLQLLARLNQNLVTLFNTMATDFEGVLVNPQGCGCTEVEILAAINQNIVNFGQVYTGGSGGTGEWGDITGNIEDQTDLQSELDAKQDLLNNSAGLAAALSDETGSGFAVFNELPTIVGYSLTGSSDVVYTAMPALAVNMAKPGNTYSATGDVTFTYSDPTPSRNIRTIVKISADGTARTITIPSTWSLARGGNITTLLVAANTTLAVMLEYTGARWEIYGDPVATTGTGSFVLATAPTVTNGVNSVSAPTTTSLGYLGVPQNSQSAAYTTVLSDAGKEVFHPSSDNNARTFTIDSNANVAYPIGTVILFTNMAATASTIAITSDTLYLAGTGSTGSRTLAQYGTAAARKITSTNWVISGSGLS